MSPILKSLVSPMEIHLKIRNKPGMTKTKVIKIAKVRMKRNGIIIVPRINIKTLLRKGGDCQMMIICRRLSENFRDTSDKRDCNREYTLHH